MNQYVTSIKFTDLGFFDSLWEYMQFAKIADTVIWYHKFWGSVDSAEMLELSSIFKGYYYCRHVETVIQANASRKSSAVTSYDKFPT